jgi:hypothetical protein
MHAEKEGFGDSSPKLFLWADKEKVSSKRNQPKMTSKKGLHSPKANACRKRRVWEFPPNAYL